MKDRMGKTLSSQEVAQKAMNRFYNIWADFGLMLIRIIACAPSHHFRRLVYRLAGMKIGKGSTVHMGANFFSLKNIQIGQDSIVGRKVFIDGRDQVKIGDHTTLASEVMIYNSQHDIDSHDFGAILKPVEIGDYVFIGPRVIILPGVKIGRGAVVGAGAVVSQDVKDMEVAGGVPAKFIRLRKVKQLKYRIGRARLFQ